MNHDEPYETLAGEGASETVVERSRFLGFALPVDDLDRAMEWVETIRSEHYDARHVCYGLRIGRGAQGVDRSNDDGEPARTGGFPLWQLLEGAELFNALLVVVRYYGGVKLGTGGLARAYRDAGRLALEEAGTRTVHPETSLSITIEYDTTGKFEHTLGELDTVRVVNTTYAADVTYELAVRSLALESVKERLGWLLQRDPDDL